MKKRLLIVCAVIFCGFGISVKTLGSGLDNASVGIKASVMGTAFTGIADDASAVHHNPGGLSFNDKEELYVQIYSHYQLVSFTRTGPAGKDESDETYINPGLFLSKTYDKWAFGYGSYLPFGGGGYAFEDLEGIPGNDVEILMGLMAMHSAVAYRLRPDLSIGAGVFVYMGNYSQESMGYENEYEGIAGYGGNIGVMYNPSDKLSIGFNIRSKSSIKMDGEEQEAGIKYDSEIEFTLPYYFDLGFGYKPTQSLTLGLNFVRMTWSDTDEYKFTRLGSVETHFEDSWRMGLGLEYIMNDKLSVRAGLKYTNPSSDKKYLYAGSSEIDLWIWTAGAAYAITESVELNFAGLYNYGYEEYDSQEYKAEHFFLTVGARFRY